MSHLTLAFLFFFHSILMASVGTTASEEQMAMLMPSESPSSPSFHCEYQEPIQDEMAVGPFTVEYPTPDGTIAVNCYSNYIDGLKDELSANSSPKVWGRIGWTSLPFDIFFTGSIDPRLSLKEQDVEYPNCNPGSWAVILRYDKSASEIACSASEADMEILSSLEQSGYKQIVQMYLDNLDQY